MQAYLQQLISDPKVGYLFPHRAAVGAFGVPNEYQLNKHRPKLAEHQHWCKLRGSDHIDRVYYSLAGLLLLADLIATPQAQAFKQALMQHCQGGAMVKAQSMPLYQPSTVSTALYTEPVLTTPFPPDITPSDPAYVLARYRQSESLRGIEQSISNHAAASAPSAYQSPQDTAALIFEAQRVASEQIFKAQKIVTDQQPPEIHVTLNVWERWDSWLAQQDAFVFSLVAAGLIALTGLGSWLLVVSAVRNAPVPTSNYSTQSN